MGDHVEAERSARRARLCPRALVASTKRAASSESLMNARRAIEEVTPPFGLCGVLGVLLDAFRRDAEVGRLFDAWDQGFKPDTRGMSDHDTKFDDRGGGSDRKRSF